jgi:hypothetical protein
MFLAQITHRVLLIIPPRHLLEMRHLIRNPRQIRMIRKHGINPPRVDILDEYNATNISKVFGVAGCAVCGGGVAVQSDDVEPGGGAGVDAWDGGEKEVAVDGVAVLVHEGADAVVGGFAGEEAVFPPGFDGAVPGFGEDEVGVGGLAHGGGDFGYALGGG